MLLKSKIAILLFIQHPLDYQEDTSEGFASVKNSLFREKKLTKRAIISNFMFIFAMPLMIFYLFCFAAQR